MFTLNTYNLFNIHEYRQKQSFSDLDYYFLFNHRSLWVIGFPCSLGYWGHPGRPNFLCGGRNSQKLLDLVFNKLINNLAAYKNASIFFSQLRRSPKKWWPMRRSGISCRERPSLLVLTAYCSLGISHHNLVFFRSFRGLHDLLMIIHINHMIA